MIKLKENKTNKEKINSSTNEITYNKLLDAEKEIQSTNKRYSADEVLKSMTDTIKKY